MGKKISILIATALTLCVLLVSCGGDGVRVLHNFSQIKLYL